MEYSYSKKYLLTKKKYKGMKETNYFDEILGIFKQVCRNFYNQYPEIITDYVMFYKEMYEEE